MKSGSCFGSYFRPGRQLLKVVHQYAEGRSVAIPIHIVLDEFKKYIRVKPGAEQFIQNFTVTKGGWILSSRFLL